MRAKSGSLSTAARKSWRSSVLTAAVAAGLLFFGSGAWAQEETGEPAQALRLLGAGLGRLYEAALKVQGFDVTVVDAEEASRLGLAKAAINIWGAQF